MERLLLRPEEAAEMCGVSRTKLYELMAKGEIPSVKVGASKRVPLDRLRARIREMQEIQQSGGAPVA